MKVEIKEKNCFIATANQTQYLNFGCDDNIAYLFCAKHPFHKFFVGYEGKSLSKDHPQYLYAYNGDNQLALNMIDAPDKKFFSNEMIAEGLKFIDNKVKEGTNVVVVCNKGESRSPTMVLMYLMLKGYYSETLSVEEVFKEFLLSNPTWKPNKGILEYAKDFWNSLKNRGDEK